MCIDILREYLKKLVAEHILSYFKILRSKKHRDILQNIEEYNSFCKDATLSQKVYNIIHNIKELPKCKNPNCFNNFQKPLKFYNISDGYYEFCCKKCSSNDKITKQKYYDTMEKLYGVRIARQCEEINNKARNTNILKYGSTSSLGNKTIRDKAKQTRLEKYGDENYTNREKFKKTMNDKYWSKPEEMKKVTQKSIDTSLSRYGVEFPMQNPDICLPAINHTFNTIKSRYGVDKVYDIPGVKDKIKKSQIIGTEKFKLMSIQTNIQKHGVPYFTQTEEYKIKSKQTYIDNFGVDHWTKCHDFRKIVQKRYLYNGITFDSSWELAYYIFNIDNKINVTYQPDIKFEYEYDGIKHSYFPDFKVDDGIIEIKGTQYFENGDVNRKMICPYKQKKYNQEYINALYEAKHQCMLKNGVKILTEKDIKPILKYIKEKYGKDYLKQFKRVKNSK